MTINATVPRRASGQLTLASLVRTYPVLAYFVTAFALSWSYWLLVLGLLGRDGLVWFAAGAFGPGIAALLITGSTEGREGVRAFLRRLVQWRVGWPWYVFILVGLPMLGVLTGVPFSDGSQRFAGPMPALAITYFTSYAFLVVLGGGQEELGWRGFALPRLQRRLGAVRASVVLGLAWGTWHLPVFLFVPNYNNAGSGLADVVMMFTVFTVAGAVGQSLLLTWLFNRTQGSVLVAVLAHASLNAAAGFVSATSTAAIALFLVFAAVGWTLAWQMSETRFTPRRPEMLVGQGP